MPSERAVRRDLTETSTRDNVRTKLSLPDGSGEWRDPRLFEDEYRAAIGAVLADAKLEVPADQRPILGGRA